jgi:epoxyqueuosine reductase
MYLRAHRLSAVQVVEKARELGASLAGIAGVDLLKRSPSYAAYAESPYYSNYTGVEWPLEARSVLVLALAHPLSEPELDWWGAVPGRTIGNRRLIETAEKMKAWLKHLGIVGHPLPYKVEDRGVLLKDAAVLAGLGVIGKNNLLITPEFGPRVRLRALFLESELEATGPLDFAPCTDCDAPCHQACPQQAFPGGTYNRRLCSQQMRADEANPVSVHNWIDLPLAEVVQYCRACELACVVGRGE